MHTELTLWRFSSGENVLGTVTVPGDVTADLHRLGQIGDPFFGLQHKTLHEHLMRDYRYETEFTFSPESTDLCREQLLLTFFGIDLFSDIYLNGKLLGHTENMFRAYEYDISDIVVPGVNRLEVSLYSTLAHMETMDCSRYFGVFNTPRVLLRKEQCCFGWDWSPDIPGYGIWQPVVLHSEPRERIVDLHYTADTDGETVFYAELNYYERSHYDNDGNFVEVSRTYNDFFRVSVSLTPDGEGEWITRTQPVSGNRNFIILQHPAPELWWPVGYGKQPLYKYKVELLRDGNVISCRKGRLAYRTVGLRQKAVDEQSLGYQFMINGKEIYIKGSNWVPVDCFTGTLRKERYSKLIDQAVCAHINMLRIWGGGIYENDCFYDLCDERGIMVWQDFMLACGDIPDDRPEWVENMLAECEYQIKRLRNHPSLVYWCGGNEKTGSFGTKVKYGDRFVDVTLRGLTAHLDGTRPYGRQSPFSMTDIANDPNSGESHRSSFEASIAEGITRYRETVASQTVPFVSECAVMGPSSRQTFERIFPADKMWPMNEYWVDRLMCNPYAALRMDFCEEQKMFAEGLYGTCRTVDDYIARGMMMHAETLRCEIEHQRAQKGVTGGFLNWMYSEIWPSATWAVVDYYGEPKQAYYQMARSYAPVLMSCYYEKDGNTYLFGVNDTLSDVPVTYTVSQKMYDGTVLWQSDGKTVLSCDGVFRLPVKAEEGTYLSVVYSYGEQTVKTLYSPDMWRLVPTSGAVTYTTEQTDACHATVTLRAKGFAKSVYLCLPDNCRVKYSDNYIDLESGEQVTVSLVSEEPMDLDRLRVNGYEANA